MKGKIKNIRNGLNEQQKFIKEKYENYTVCKRCHIIYVDGKWQYNDELYEKLKKEKKITKTIICPICKQIENNYPLGIIYVNAILVEERLDEIKNMIANLEEEQKKENHIMDRFMSLSIENNYYIFKTTTANFAKKIANKIEHLIHKKAEYHWNDNEGLLRVYIKE